MAQIEDYMAFLTLGMYQDPDDVGPWTGQERSGFFAAYGLLGDQGLPGAAEAVVGGLMKFGTRETED